jgi:UDP-N-acetylmuramate dehydrogenase
VGSTFANPPGDAAGRLIEAVGLKGQRRGGAQISTLHANFFINEGDASASDFLYLMALARVNVREHFGVELRPEVWFVGFDGHATLTELEHTIAKSLKET